jgi:hypothetical protein
MGRGDARLDGRSVSSRTTNRPGDLSKFGLVRTASSNAAFGPPTTQFNSMRSNSRKATLDSNNTFPREGSSHGSRAASPTKVTASNVTSANAFEYVHIVNES